MARVRRGWPWVAAAILHAGLLALLAQVARPRAPEADDLVVDLEVTAQTERRREAIAEPVEEVPEPEPATPERQAPGRRAPRRAARAAPPRAQEPAGGGAMGETAETGLGLGWGLGALGDGSGGAGGGAGGQAGGGRGGGQVRAATVRAAPRRISRARPPRLVYPKRFRDEGPGDDVFIAVLTIDEDGWVVGVRLVQGVNPHADQKAAEAVWRFHYSPALDADGHPTRARVRQRFMVD